MSVSAILPSFLALTISVLTLHAVLVCADHYTCTWKAHDGSPEKVNYTHFCRAQLLRDNSDNTFGDWVCAAGNVATVGTKVADYSRLRNKILEMASPCAHRGYAFEDGTCIANTWAMCWGPSSQGNCLYQNAKDDCEWPQEQQSDKLPGEINIWFHKGRGYVEDK